MHKSSILRMKWFVDQFAAKLPMQKVKVLDVGGLDIDATYRRLFPTERYEFTALDMKAGPNVDLVLKNPYDWSAIPTDSFDVVISGQVFEHAEFFWITMAEMARVIGKDGLLCVIAPNGFVEHRYPVDCYRFFTDGMLALARYVSLEPLNVHTNCAPSLRDADWYSDMNADAMLIARKPYAGPTKHPDLKTYQCAPENQETLRGGLVPYPKSRKRNRGSRVQRLWHKVKRHLV